MMKYFECPQKFKGQILLIVNKQDAIELFLKLRRIDRTLQYVPCVKFRVHLDVPSNFSFLDYLLDGYKNNILSPLSIGQGQGLCDQDGILFILRTFHHQKYI